MLIAMMIIVTSLGLFFLIKNMFFLTIGLTFLQLQACVCDLVHLYCYYGLTPPDLTTFLSAVLLVITIIIVAIFINARNMPW